MKKKQSYTDTERLDFLHQQRITRWVGFSNERQVTFWPVFPGQDLRAEIDKAMEASRVCRTA